MTSLWVRLSPLALAALIGLTATEDGFACDPTGAGVCCAFYTPEGLCAQEYPCPSCFPNQPAPMPDPAPFPGQGCVRPGVCCYHWTAPGQCVHEAPCTQC